MVYGSYQLTYSTYTATTTNGIHVIMWVGKTHTPFLLYEAAECLQTFNREMYSIQTLAHTRA